MSKRAIDRAVAKVTATADEIGAILQRSTREHKQNEEDRRALRGKYAPPTGKCSCGGKVVPDIVFPWDGRLGGGPIQGRVKDWYCEVCGLTYRFPSVDGKRVDAGGLKR